MASERTGADAINDVLVSNGVDQAFGIVSIHNMPIMDAFKRHGSIAVIDSRHEQAAMHEADGYARASGRIGVALASTGPGTTNTVTGLYEAAHASSPALLITGQAETGYLGKGMGYVHEHELQEAMLRTVAPHVASPRSAASVPGALAEVMRNMLHGRRQPGAIEVPIDLQYASVGDAEAAASLPAAAIDQDGVARAIEMIQSSRKRLIIAGGGVVGGNAARELRELAEALEAPVLTTSNGRGSLPEEHELALGNNSQNPMLMAECDQADLTIAIGTRFQVGVDGRNRLVQPPGRLLHTDVDPGSVNRVFPADLAVVGDARATLRALIDNLNPSAGDPDFLNTARTAKSKLTAVARERIGRDHAGIMDALREALPDETPIVRDSTVPAYFWANNLFPIRQPRTSISPTSGAIGPGLPLGIGAAVGAGCRSLVIHGDGGFQLHVSELSVAARHQIPVLVCVFNDGGYGILRFLQKNRFDGRFTDTDLGKYDFAKVAEGFGVPARKVASLEEFEAGLAEGMATNGPYLLDIDETRLEPIAGMVMPQS